MTTSAFFNKVCRNQTFGIFMRRITKNRHTRMSAINYRSCFDWQT